MLSIMIKHVSNDNDQANNNNKDNTYIYEIKASFNA